MSFDPYAMAREHGDVVSLQKWEHFGRSIHKDIVLIFKHSPFLQHERPAERDDYGPLHEVWEDSTQQIMAIFEEALSESLESLREAPPIETDSYVPPDGWGRAGGGPWFPMELMQMAVDHPWIAGVGSSLIYDGLKAAYHALSEWFDEHRVPEGDRTGPRLSPSGVRSFVEGHARHYFPKLDPGQPQIISGGNVDENYPMRVIPFMVLMPYERGAIVYFVDNRLQLSAIIITAPGGFRRLRTKGWPAGLVRTQRTGVHY